MKEKEKASANSFLLSERSQKGGAGEGQAGGGGGVARKARVGVGEEVLSKSPEVPGEW